MPETPDRFRYLYLVLNVVRVHDGDTVELVLDKGMCEQVKKICRLFGIDAAELKKDRETAEAARHRLAQLLMRKPIVCETHKDKTEKYGRLLVTLTNADGVEVNGVMLQEGHAFTYKDG
jgi:endonuclease YncB( thermonuclease family)